MSNYLYLRNTDRSLPERFSTGEMGPGYAVSGVPEWREYTTRLLEYLSAGDGGRQEIRALILRELRNFYLVDTEGEQAPYRILSRSTEELILMALLFTLRGVPRVSPGPLCPRLFISHRQPDTSHALRIAALAAKHSFAYWLDILDPALKSLSASPPLPAHLLPLITACIIEMAVLNCTHVIGCMTPLSAGSAWIPYEYGRIRDNVLVSVNASVWIHPRLVYTHLPDYMHLGEIHFNEREIEQWMSAEYRRLGRSGCVPVLPDPEVVKAGSLP